MYKRQEYVGSMPYHNLGSVHYAWFWNNNEYADWNHGHKGAYYSYSSQEVPISNPVWGGYPPSDNDVNAGSYEFHIYGINWLSDRMEFYVDQKIYHIHYFNAVSYTHLRAHETVLDLVCRLLLEKKKYYQSKTLIRSYIYSIRQ